MATPGDAAPQFALEAAVILTVLAVVVDGGRLIEAITLSDVRPAKFIPNPAFTDGAGPLCALGLQSVLLHKKRSAGLNMMGSAAWVPWVSWVPGSFSAEAGVCFQELPGLVEQIKFFPASFSGMGIDVAEEMARMQFHQYLNIKRVVAWCVFEVASIRHGSVWGADLPGTRTGVRTKEDKKTDGLAERIFSRQERKGRKGTAKKTGNPLFFSVMFSWRFLDVLGERDSGKKS